EALGELAVAGGDLGGIVYGSQHRRIGAYVIELVAIAVLPIGEEGLEEVRCRRRDRGELGLGGAGDAVERLSCAAGRRDDEGDRGQAPGGYDEAARAVE